MPRDEKNEKIFALPTDYLPKVKRFLKNERQRPYITAERVISYPSVSPTDVLLGEHRYYNV